MVSSKFQAIDFECAIDCSVRPVKTERKSDSELVDASTTFHDTNSGSIVKPGGILEIAGVLAAAVAGHLS